MFRPFADLIVAGAFYELKIGKDDLLTYEYGTDEMSFSFHMLCECSDGAQKIFRRILKERNIVPVSKEELSSWKEYASYGDARYWFKGNTQWHSFKTEREAIDHVKRVMWKLHKTSKLGRIGDTKTIYQHHTSPGWDCMNKATYHTIHVDLANSHRSHAEREPYFEIRRFHVTKTVEETPNEPEQPK